MSGGRRILDRFFVQAEPKAQPRHRTNTITGRRYTPDTADAWKAALSAFLVPIAPEEPIAAAMRLDLEFRFKRPRSHFKANGRDLTKSAPRFHTSKPDKDNLAKCVMDQMTRIRFVHDDRYVVAGETCKAWTTAEPGVFITLEILEDQEAES